jgi:hypothetical protein
MKKPIAILTLPQDATARQLITATVNALNEHPFLVRTFEGRAGDGSCFTTAREAGESIGVSYLVGRRQNP